MTTRRLETAHGPALAHLHLVTEPAAALVLGHGAGGSVAARDLLAVTAVAREVAVSVALVEQPYRVAGRRSPAPAHQLDAAWIAAVEQLRSAEVAGLPLLVGGRSAGARVACRTAAATRAAGVLCLAFPLVPPPPRSGGPPKTRQEELDAVGVPTLVVQGARDRFGQPPAGPNRRVAVVAGDHRLTTDLDAVAEAVRVWLAELLAGGLGAPGP
jgi:predicted alpha/beta-hydrolase family hydrolase